MNGALDRARLLKLFDELSDELRFTRTRAHIYVIGGAAMSLAFVRERTTMDVDVRIDSGQSRLTEAVRTVGRRHGLPDAWLNEQATSAIPRTPDPCAHLLYESPHLTVTGASARHLLAMKLLAARNADRADIAALIDHLGLKSPTEAIRIYEALFPDVPLKSEARDTLRRVFSRRD